MKHEKICPLCNGDGKLNFNPTKMKIKELYKMGLTIRQIAKITGKGSTTIHYWIKKH